MREKLTYMYAKYTKYAAISTPPNLPFACPQANKIQERKRGFRTGVQIPCKSVFQMNQFNGPSS